MKKIITYLMIVLLIVGCSPKEKEIPHLNEEGQIVELTTQEESAQILNKHAGDIIEQQMGSRSGLDLVVLLESSGVVTEGIKFDTISLSDSDIVTGKGNLKYAVGMFEVKLENGDVYKMPVASSFEHGQMTFGEIDKPIQDFIELLK